METVRSKLLHNTLKNKRRNDYTQDRFRVKFPASVKDTCPLVVSVPFIRWHQDGDNLVGNPAMKKDRFCSKVQQKHWTQKKKAGGKIYEYRRLDVFADILAADVEETAIDTTWSKKGSKNVLWEYDDSTFRVTIQCPGKLF